MEKYKSFLIAFGIIVSIAGFVYAFVIDTDGGYNIYQRGTCTSNNGTGNVSYTDYCLKPDLLKEYYPSNYTQGNQTIDFCASQIVLCVNGSSCINGRCILFDR